MFFYYKYIILQYLKKKISFTSKTNLRSRVKAFSLNKSDVIERFMMTWDQYFQGVAEAVKFLVALGSLVGLLGLLLGVIFILFGGDRLRWKMLGIVVVSCVLLGLCGIYTGLNYFHIRIR